MADTRTDGCMDGFFFLSNYVSNSGNISSANSSVLSYFFLFVYLWPVLKTAQTFLPPAMGTQSRCEGSQPSVRAIQAQSLLLCEGSQPSLRAIQAQSLLLCDQVMLQKCLLKPSNTGYQFILLPKAQWLKGSVSIWSLFRQDTCETIAQLMMDNFSHTTGSHQGWILSSSKWATPHKAMKEWNKIPRAKTSVSLDN